MKIENIDPILERFYTAATDRKLAPGVYCRTTKGGSRVPNAYGCADAANILYTLNRFPRDPDERAAHVRAIQSFQDPARGIFLDETHGDIHTTAHCTAALELFDARPLHPFTELWQYTELENLYRMFEDMDWLHCGKAAHNGAGLYAAFVNAGCVGADWTRGYFDYLNKTCDAATGLWVKKPAADYFTIYYQIGDAFHYLFNYENAKQAFPYPEALIDSCIDAYYSGGMGDNFAKNHGFIQMDWVYCLNRASRQTAHRFDEVKAALSDFAEKYIAFLRSDAANEDPHADDLHLIFGTICCLAELQQALPGKLASSVPLRLVLDRRPFI